MKNRLEHLLLLEQSGELSPGQRRRLDVLRRQGDAPADPLEKEMHWLASNLSGPPAPASSTEILQERIHHRLTEQGGTAHAAYRPAIWLAAAASVALLVAGIRFAMRPPAAALESAAAGQSALEEAWEDPYETEFAQLESLIASISVDAFWDDTDL